MESKTVTYFEWSDIQKAICNEMGIDEKDFRDYHRVVGGEYKDLWHIWLHYFDTVYNGMIARNDLGERMDSKLEWIKEDGKGWAEPFVRAVYKVWDENGIENVRYFW